MDIVNRASFGMPPSPRNLTRLPEIDPDKLSYDAKRLDMLLRCEMPRDLLLLPEEENRGYKEV